MCFKSTNRKKFSFSAIKFFDRSGFRTHDRKWFGFWNKFLRNISKNPKSSENLKRSWSFSAKKFFWENCKNHVFSWFNDFLKKNDKIIFVLTADHISQYFFKKCSVAIQTQYICGTFEIINVHNLMRNCCFFVFFLWQKIMTLSRLNQT
jgi:hypothetical protein